MLAVLEARDERSHCLADLAQVPKWPDALPVLVTKKPLLAQRHRLESPFELELPLCRGHKLAHEPLDWPHPAPWRWLVLLEQLRCVLHEPLCLEQLTFHWPP